MRIDFSSKKRLIKMLLIALLIMLCLWLLSKCVWRPKPPEPSIPTVPVMTLSYHEVPLTKNYIGISESIASVDIRARVKGFLTSMTFVEGGKVKKGQRLFTIDPSSFKAQLTLAQGQLSSAIADKEFQSVEYLRYKNLVAKGDVSKSNFDQVTAQYENAVAKVQIAAAQVEDAKINLSYTTMYSPIDGIVSYRYVDVGNLVGGAEDTLLANVNQINPIYVQFSPSVSDYAEFLLYRENMPFPVEVRFPENNNIVLKGKMNLVNNQADIPTSTLLMRATIDNPDALLIPGVYVNVKLILTDKKKVLLIPLKAVMETQGQRSIFLLKKDSTVKPEIIITQGQYQDSYIVTKGVKEGDQVVIEGLQKLKPGMKVMSQPAAN